MIQAAIFDMNGVIVNDEEYQKKAWRLYAKKTRIADVDTVIESFQGVSLYSLQNSLNSI